MKKDYIMRFGEGLFNEETGEACFMPELVGELVRCKDCKHRDVENGSCKGRGWPMQLVPDDGFCDKGERGEDDNA